MPWRWIGRRTALVVGTTAGQIWTIGSTILDSTRQSGDATLAAVPFADLSAPVNLLEVAPDGATIVAVIGPTTDSTTPDSTTPDSVVVLDGSTAAEVGRRSVGPVVAISEAGSGSVAVAIPEGVLFIDSATATFETTVRLAGPPGGMAFTTNLDKDRLYVSLPGDGRSARGDDQCARRLRQPCP